MLTKLELALIIQNNKAWHMSKKINALKYISEIENLSETESLILETYFRDENTPPKLETNLITLAKHYLMVAAQEKCTLNTLVLKIQEPLKDHNVNSPQMFQYVLNTINANTAAKVNIRILIYDALLDEYGDVVWYDPISTLMSVRWSDGGFTVRSLDTTKRMFSLAKRIGAKDNANNSREENVQSL